MDRLLLPVLLGTNRKLRRSEFAAKWLIGEMDKRPYVETRLFDVAEFALPQDNYGQEIKHLFPEWRDAIKGAEGLVIVTPEYNHGYPGSLKAVLDLLLREYVHNASPLKEYRLVVRWGSRDRSNGNDGKGIRFSGHFHRSQFPVSSKEV